jgi:L-ascorbate metabolism protein UlaG (beta-lactamase superfamily)
MTPRAARIVYVGHATVLVDLDGVRLLTDPVLRPRLMHLRRVGKVDAGVLRGVDAVLVSHAHFDHLDLPSLERLGRELPVVVPRGAAALLRRRGFRAVTELDVGEELHVGALSIRGTPARHPSERMPFGLKADPMGHLIAGSRSVYFAGDTERFEGMADLGPVDVALLPVWGWGPTLGPGHMGPRDAAEAAQALRAATAIPIHWGTLFPVHRALRSAPDDVERPAEEFAEHLRELAPGIEARVLRPGEETTF